MLGGDAVGGPRDEIFGFHAGSIIPYRSSCMPSNGDAVDMVSVDASFLNDAYQCREEGRGPKAEDTYAMLSMGWMPNFNRPRLQTWGWCAASFRGPNREVTPHSGSRPKISHHRDPVRAFEERIA